LEKLGELITLQTRRLLEGKETVSSFDKRQRSRDGSFLLMPFIVRVVSFDRRGFQS
jgi:hypothetical protein